jgi:hypothetical protein
MRDRTPVPNITGTYCDKHGIVKVMGMVDGYVVARRPTCYPFIEFWKVFLQKYQKGTVFDG